jgi:hypothetical protein
VDTYLQHGYIIYTNTNQNVSLAVNLFSQKSKALDLRHEAFPFLVFYHLAMSEILVVCVGQTDCEDTLSRSKRSFIKSLGGDRGGCI